MKHVIASGTVSVLAGNGAGTVNGALADALFNGIEGLTTDGKALYIGEESAHKIRKIQ